MAEFTIDTSDDADAAVDLGIALRTAMHPVKFTFTGTDPLPQHTKDALGEYMNTCAGSLDLIDFYDADALVGMCSNVTELRVEYSEAEHMEHGSVFDLFCELQDQLEIVTIDLPVNYAEGSELEQYFTDPETFLPAVTKFEVVNDAGLGGQRIEFFAPLLVEMMRSLNGTRLVDFSMAIMMDSHERIDDTITDALTAFLRNHTNLTRVSLSNALSCYGEDDEEDGEDVQDGTTPEAARDLGEAFGTLTSLRTLEIVNCAAKGGLERVVVPALVQSLRVLNITKSVIKFEDIADVAFAKCPYLERVVIGENKRTTSTDPADFKFYYGYPQIDFVFSLQNANLWNEVRRRRAKAVREMIASRSLNRQTPGMDANLGHRVDDYLYYVRKQDGNGR